MAEVAAPRSQTTQAPQNEKPDGMIILMVVIIQVMACLHFFFLLSHILDCFPISLTMNLSRRQPRISPHVFFR